MKIYINGQPQELNTSLSVKELLVQFGLENKRIAVEINGEIITRSQFAYRLVVDNDKVEIIIAVGGG